MIHLQGRSFWPKSIFSFFKGAIPQWKHLLSHKPNSFILQKHLPNLRSNSLSEKKTLFCRCGVPTTMGGKNILHRLLIKLFLFEFEHHYQQFLSHVVTVSGQRWDPASILYKSTADRYWPFSYPDRLFVCVEVLRPSQPNGVMSSAVSLPNHMFTGQA